MRHLRPPSRPGGKVPHIDSVECWCRPTVDGDLCLHHSADNATARRRLATLLEEHDARATEYLRALRIIDAATREQVAAAVLAARTSGLLPIDRELPGDRLTWTRFVAGVVAARLPA